MSGALGNTVGLTLRVLRTDRRTRTSAILTAVGTAIATGLVLLLLGLPNAAAARAERSAWQHPARVGPGQASALLATTVDHLGEQEITRIDLAVTGDPARWRLPVGVPRVVRPGEVLLSRALADRVREVPRNQLGDRFGGSVVGVLGDESLAYPGQLVAVAGQNASTMPPDSVPVAGLGAPPRPDGMLTFLAWFGLVVLLFPSVSLAASAAKLTASRRERRLAALLLAGGTPRQVGTMVAVEAGVAAVAGSLAGVPLGAVLRTTCTGVPWDGGSWFPGDLSLPWWLTAVAVVTMPLLVAGSVLLGVRPVVRSPLGVHVRTPPSPLRLLMIPAAGALFAIATAGTGMTFVLVALAVVIGTASIVGPWVTAAVGQVFVRTWRRPSALLAGRRLLADPKAAYRSTAGVVLAVFVGAMSMTVFDGLSAATPGPGDAFADAVPFLATDAAHVRQLTADADRKLAEYGVPGHAAAIGRATLRTADGTALRALVATCADAAALTRFDVRGRCPSEPAIWSTEPLPGQGFRLEQVDRPATFVALPPVPVHQIGGADDLAGSVVVDPSLVPAALIGDDWTVAAPVIANADAVHTALAAAAPGVSVTSKAEQDAESRRFGADLYRVTVIGVLTAVGLAGLGAGLTAAGSVLDRRRTFGALVAAGTSSGVLARAVRAEAALPALVTTVGAGVGGVGAGLGLVGFVGRSGIGSPGVLAPVALGVLAALLAASATVPALRRIEAEPLSDE